MRYLHIKNERRDFMTDSTDFKGILEDIKKTRQANKSINWEELTITQNTIYWDEHILDWKPVCFQYCIYLSFYYKLCSHWGSCKKAGFK